MNTTGKVKWFVYIAKCKDDSLYTGITVNPRRRESLHNSRKGASSLKSKIPVKIIYLEQFNSKFEAARREKAIKNWKKEYKLKLIRKQNPGFTL